MKSHLSNFQTRQTKSDDPPARRPDPTLSRWSHRLARSPNFPKFRFDMFEGEIYISVDRVLENASIYNVEPDDELKRMAVHGVLHFLGYKDKTDPEKREMTERENYYISL